MKVSTYSVQILATCPIKSSLRVIRDQHTPISSSLSPLIIFLAIAIVTKLMPNSYEFVSHKTRWNTFAYTIIQEVGHNVEFNTCKYIT